MKTEDTKFRFVGSEKNQTSNNAKAIIFSVCLFVSATVFGQSQTYGTFEGYKSLYFGAKTGTLDSVAKNPSMNKVYNKENCIKYVRSGTEKYDYIKMPFLGKLTDVVKYTSYAAGPPVITMKVYTTAPVGTLIQIQLAKYGKNDYPAGVNSEFQARTTVTNAWEVLRFKFAQMPKGSEVSTKEVNQMNILFSPNSSNKDTYYFCDITGPALVSEKPKVAANVSSGNKTAVK